MKDFIRHTLCPLIGAIIWGTAFTAQSIASDFVGPFSLNAFRGLVAAVILILICLVRGKSPGNRKALVKGSLLTGLALFAASNAQQLGIGETSAGKSGFVTALYIVLVPLLSTFLGKRPGKRVWISVAIATVGLYFLCVSERFTVSPADISLLLCALFFALQILSVDRWSAEVDEIALSAGEFLVTGVLSALLALLTEQPAVADFRACIGPLLYVAVFSSCIAYTLQIIAQKGGNASKISLLMSLEAVFAVLSGAVILHERLTAREYAGCLLMAAAVVLAQLPAKQEGAAPAPAAEE